MLDVLILPYEENNPYQDNFSKYLSEIDVNTHSTGPHPKQIIRELLRNRDIEIIHIHWTYPFFVSDSVAKSILRSSVSLIFFTILKIIGYDFIWTAHNLTEHEKRHPDLEVFAKSIFCTIICDYIIVHNEFARESIKETLFLFGRATPIAVIPHGNFIENYENEVTKEEARKELGYENELVYLFIGQIRAYKQVPYLIESFKQLPEDRIQLLIAGNPKTQELKREIYNESNTDSRISCRLEFIPSNELQTYLNAADVVVLPYSDIFTSGSAMLALSFGKPLIVPDIPPLRETLDENGAIFYDPTMDTLQDALLRARERNLEDMGKHNYRKANSLSWAEIAGKTKKVYHTTQ
ncbi:glycosyltransferase family 4 protein [Halogeometricum borinquense]|uniref:glycosyltransferase family 4 protein n=1 Tax=Halogeometricum borinquense TaxID=60847 RepID=UPI00342D3A88